MVAISYGSQVRLWGICEDGTRTNIGYKTKSYFYSLLHITFLTDHIIVCLLT